MLNTFINNLNFLKGGSRRERCQKEGKKWISFNRFFRILKNRKFFLFFLNKIFMFVSV